MEFRTLPDFPQYKIYSNGTIWSDYYKKFLVPEIDEKGYYRVIFYNNGNRKHFQVHRLVALLFLENPNNFPDVNHKDENKNNNDVSNLEWCNKQYNNDYGTRNQRISLANSKQIRCIETNQIFISAKEAEDKLNIDASSIRKVCRGERKTAGGYHWERIEK